MKRERDIYINAYYAFVYNDFSHTIYYFNENVTT